MSFPIDAATQGKFVLGREFESWKVDYVPKSGLKGKTVLDVGAGCGETAWFFFGEGASKVICIEKDLVKLTYLRDNAKKWSWNVSIIDRAFILEDLAFDFDYMKMDIEGGEKVLLGIHSIPPCTIEIHSPTLAERFKQVFPNIQIEKKYHWPFSTWMGKLE